MKNLITKYTKEQEDKAIALGYVRDKDDDNMPWEPKYICTYGISGKYTLYRHTGCANRQSVESL